MALLDIALVRTLKTRIMVENQDQIGVLTRLRPVTCGYGYITLVRTLKTGVMVENQDQIGVLTRLCPVTCGYGDTKPVLRQSPGSSRKNVQSH